MNILHIAPSSPFNDNFGYQENILPKYHKKMGHNVSLIISNYELKNDKREITNRPGRYYLDSGVLVIRKEIKKHFGDRFSFFLSDMDIYRELVELKPDFIFFHGLVSVTFKQVIKYKKKNPNCVIVRDNHLDWEIGYKPKSIKGIIAKAIYVPLNKKAIKYVEKVYGVTPWRAEYAQKFFKIPKQKTDVLIMGADDEKIRFEKYNEIRSRIRKRFGVKNNEFLVVSGGKLDGKKKIKELILACKNISNVKLLIFGGFSPDMEMCTNLIDNSKIMYAGWINSSEVYDYFFASDLVAFPGRHSVLWEQACASKTPCIFSDWPGMHHIDNGGTACFFDGTSVSDIQKSIEKLLFTKKYYELKKKCSSELTDIYLYSNVAKKSLECLTKKNKSQ